MLTILERRIDVRGGHEETQVKAIQRLSGRQDLEILTSTGAPAGHTTKSSFDFPLHRVLAPSAHKAEAGEDMLRQDAQAMAGFFDGRSRQDALLVPTATLYDIRLMLAGLRQGVMPDVIALRVLEERHIAGLSAADRSLLDKATADGRVRIVTETASLSTRLLDQYAVASEPHLVLPCTIQPEQTSLAPTRDHSFRVGFLGNARREKGWHDLPQIIGALSQLIAAKPLERPIEFIVPRARKSVLKPSNIARSLKLHVHAKSGGVFANRLRVRRSPKFMPDAEFVAHLTSLDVVVLPYRPQNYAHRGSGVILDSVLAQKPLVYSAGIGMGEYLGFGNAKPAHSAAEFAAGIRDLLANPGQAQEGCEKAKAFAQRQFTLAAEFLNSL